MCVGWASSNCCSSLALAASAQQHIGVVLKVLQGTIKSEELNKFIKPSASCATVCTTSKKVWKLCFTAGVTGRFPTAAAAACGVLSSNLVWFFCRGLCASAIYICSSGWRSMHG
jgi:hypothetical protein